jgi:cytochrome P450
MEKVDCSDFLDVAYPSRELEEDPYKFLDCVRELAPVYKVPGRGQTYVVSQHEDIRSIARQPEIFSSVTGLFADFKSGKTTSRPDLPSSPATRSVLGSDAPEHTRRRKRAIRPLTPGKLEAMRPRISAIADELIARFIDRGECEFVREFARPFPALVISELLGLPPDDLELLLYFSRSDGAGRVYLDTEARKAEERRSAELGAYIERQLRDRCEDPRDDALSELVRLQLEHEGRVDVSDLAPDASILLSGGLTTTAYMLTSAVFLLLRDSEHMNELRSRPTLIERTLEEVLRLEAPVQWNPRRVVADTELRGTHLPKGALVIMAYAAGNRDPRKFDCPGAFVADRGNVKEHLAFGYGPHYCLGAPLARLEGTVAIERLLFRLGRLRLAPDRNDFRHVQSTTMRGLRRLFLRFDAPRFSATAPA